MLRRLLVPFLLASSVVTAIALEARVPRRDRLVVLALLAAAYIAYYLALEVASAVAVRLLPGLGSAPALAGLAFVSTFAVNAMLTAFGHKALAPYARLSPWTTLHPVVEMVAILGVIAVLALLARWLARHLSGLPSLGTRAAACLSLLGIALPLAPAAPIRAAPTVASTFRPAPLAPLARGPLVVVGFDGVDPKLLRAAARARSLPNFDSFLEDGFVSTLDNHGLGLSPVVWTTLITGRSPQSHGLTDFSVRESTLLIEPVDRWLGAVPPGFAVKSIVFRGLGALGGLKSRNLTGRDRRGPSVFQIASRYGRRSLVVNYLLSFPAEKIDGIFLSEYVYDARLNAGADSHALAPGYVYPPDLLDGPLGVIPALAPASPSVLDRDERRFDYTAALTLEMLAHERFDLVVFYEPWTDVFNHSLTHAEYQRMLAGDFSGELPTRFLETYAKLDTFLGALTTLLPAADVLVVSDHGVQPSYSVRKPVSGARMQFLEELGAATLPSHLQVSAHLEHLNVRHGVFLARGPGVKSGRRPSVSMYDVAPTLLAYLGVPIPRDFEGRALPDLAPDARRAGSVDSYEALVANERIEPEARLSGEAEERLRALGYVQ